MKEFVKKVNKKIINSYFFHYIELITNYRYERRCFKRRNGYNLNLKNPKTFNEKVVYKKIKDRNPILPITADKFQVKKFLLEQFGYDWTERHVIKTIAYSNKPDLNLFELPEEFILKGTHLSGFNLIKRKGINLDHSVFSNFCKKILEKQIHTFSNEWLYKKIKKGIIVEKLIYDEKNQLPIDYKFFCFNGKVKLFQVDFDRNTGIKRSLFDNHGNFINAQILHPLGPKEHDISNLDEIIKFVESLTFQLDFVRVDIYIIDKQPIFGELTHYPGSGHSRIVPYEFDLLLGGFWDQKKYS